MARFITIWSVILLTAIGAMAQTPLRVHVDQQIAPDSADISYYRKPKFWQAAATVAGLNLAVWSNDHFIHHADYAEISWSSIKANLKEGFNWDNDRLSTNMFLHPYHGNLYFNAGRSNGFNYWQSGLFALGGSAMWELFMENEYPSTNDIIATPVGGMAIGEVAFRTSDLMINDQARGWDRFGREAAVFLISPMRGLTRVINGDAWRHRETSGKVFGHPNLAGQVSFGVRAIGVKRGLFDAGGGVATELKLEYGDRFELSSTTPYDYFYLRACLNIQGSQPVLGRLNIVGRLISREIVDSEHDDLSIGMYQHYDFYDSDTLSTKSNIVPYRLGVPASVGAGVLYRGTEHGRVALDAYAHLNAVILAGVLTDHYQVGDRNYNLASGFSIKSGLNLMLGRKFVFSAMYDYYRLFTWGYPRNTDMTNVNARTLNAEGDTSVAYFGIATVRAEFMVAKHLYLTTAFSAYMRSTRYRDFDDVNSNSFTTNVMLTYKF